jgi:putative transposase
LKPTATFNNRYAVAHSLRLESKTLRAHSHPMANTFTCLHYHIIFSTKNREPWIKPEIQDRIWSFMAGIAQKNKMKTLQIGGMPDHVHLVIGLPTTVSLSDALHLMKGGSSKWIKDEFSGLRGFAWQDGYAAFTVSQSNLREVVAYVKNQSEHHRVKTFQEEYLAFLDRHGVSYDARFVFG